MSELLNFYRDEPNSSGYTYREVVHDWDDRAWELQHDFIQWLFPLKTPSNFNCDAPVLTDEEIAIFKSDTELQNRLFYATRRFLRFINLYYLTESGGVRTPPRTQKEWWGKDHPVWKSFNHNHLRITRVLASLKLFGMTLTVDEFFACLSMIFNENKAVSVTTYEYWRKAAAGEIQ